MKLSKRQRREQRERDKALSAAQNDAVLQRATAYHESAHAVFSELFDYPVESVTIVPRIDSDGIRYGQSNQVGNALYGGGVLQLGVVRILFNALVDCAGPCAEWKIGTMPDGTMPTSDLDSLQRRFNPIVSTGCPASELYEISVKSAAGILEQAEVWTAITELAELLLVQKTVQGAVVKEITRRHADKYFVSELFQLQMTKWFADQHVCEMPESFAQAMQHAQRKMVAA